MTIAKTFVATFVFAFLTLFASPAKAQELVPKEWQERARAARIAGFARLVEPTNKEVAARFYQLVEKGSDYDKYIDKKREEAKKRGNGKAVVVAIKFVPEFEGIQQGPGGVVIIQTTEEVRMEFSDGWEIQMTKWTPRFYAFKKIDGKWIAISISSYKYDPGN